MDTVTLRRWIKSVFVRDYWRFRKGQWEHVSQHFRSWPTF